MSRLAGFLRYLRFIARRERIMSTVWLVAMVLSAVSFTAMYPQVFPTEESLQSMVAAMNTPSMVAIMGPVYGLDALTPLTAMAHECLVWFAMALIVMNVLLVSRHTRADEELGRSEMLRALPLRRLTGSAAVLASAFVLNMLIALFSALGIMALNLEGSSATGAFAFSLSIGAQGFLFAAVTLLAAQLFTTAQGTTGVSFALMGASYIARALGDMQESALSVISPLGLGLKVQAFYADNFAPIFILLAEAAIVAAIALAINARRDVGAGLFAARRGRARASRFLQGSLGFVRRLATKAFIAWACAIFTTGAMCGAIVGELDRFAEDNEMIKQMLEAQGRGAGSLVDAFVPMLCAIMAMLIAIPVIGAVLRLQSEERRGRVEQLYALALPRAKLFANFAESALAQAVLLSFISALGVYSAAASTGLLSFETIMAASFAFLPAIIILAGLAALLVGLLPKLTALTWAWLGYSFFALFFGSLFDLPEWAARISPFESIPQLPVESFEALPVVAFSVAAVLMFVAGLLRYRERDIG